MGFDWKIDDNIMIYYANKFCKKNYANQFSKEISKHVSKRLKTLSTYKDIFGSIKNNLKKYEYGKMNDLWEKLKICFWLYYFPSDLNGMYSSSIFRQMLLLH